MSGRKTVLLVDDDPGTLDVLSTGLSNVLGMYDVVTAKDGRVAIDTMEARHVDLLVTDLAMPVMDGFALIAHVTQWRSALPVVVLSGMAPASMDQRLAGDGGLRVLRKPVSFQDLAACILEEFERLEVGPVMGIPLSGVLQLVESERRSCAVIVTSGKRRGRLQFESGRLVNAFSDDFGAEGEAAAYDILSWRDTAIEFETLPQHLRKLIHTPMQLMLLELAVLQDQAPSDETPGALASDGGDGAAGAAPAGDVADGDGVTGGDVDDAADARRDDVGAVDLAPAPHEDDHSSADAFAIDAVDPPPADADASDVDPMADDMAPVRLLGTGNGEAMRSDPLESEHPARSATPDLEPEAAAPVVLATSGEATRGTGDSATHDDDHVRDMVAAVERLAERARAADEALAAVAAEVDAFRTAQRRFDELSARRELRRHELGTVREDVARLAREILGRVEGVFDAMDPEASAAVAEPAPEPDAGSEAALRTPT